MWKWGKRLVANPLQTTDTVACCRKNFRHNLNVFFLYQKTKPTDVPMLIGNLPRNELTASAFATTSVSGVWGVFAFAVDAKQ